MANICICTMFSPAYQELADLTIPNMEKYAARHGYDTHIIHVEDEKWAFKKHEAFREFFLQENKYDLVWYRDIDAIITNLTIPIESFIDDEHSLFLTKDFTELNGGSIILKLDSFMWSVNCYILGASDKYDNEQNVLNMMYKTSEGVFKSMAKILPHPSINSYDYSLYKECTSHVGREDLGDWREGHFVLHVPALSIPKRLEILSQAKIIE